MADSFADLWDSSAPPKSSIPAKKLGSAISQSTSARRPQQDVFALLSSAGSSAPSSRPITPSTLGQHTSSKRVTKASEDVFSGLLVGALKGGSQNGANLTIAERTARAERERQQNMRIDNDQRQVKVQASAWDGLDQLANSFSNNTIKNPVEDDWFVPLHSVSNGFSVEQPSAPPVDDWGLADITSKPSLDFSPTPAPHSQAILDLDEIPSPVPLIGTGQPPPAIREPVPRFDSPGDFDFGNREDSLLDDDSQDEDDILGVLSKPVDAIPKRTSPSVGPNSQSC
jgi:hypothetical protein